MTYEVRAFDTPGNDDGEYRSGALLHVEPSTIVRRASCAAVQSEEGFSAKLNYHWRRGNPADLRAILRQHGGFKGSIRVEIDDYHFTRLLPFPVIVRAEGAVVRVRIKPQRRWRCRIERDLFVVPKQRLFLPVPKCIGGLNDTGRRILLDAIARECEAIDRRHVLLRVFVDGVEGGYEPQLAALESTMVAGVLGWTRELDAARWNNRAA